MQEINENKENVARKILDKVLDDMEANGDLNSDKIEFQIRSQLDRYNLTISNYWRLKEYFFDKYKKTLAKLRGST